MDVFTLFDQNFLLWIQSLRQDWMTPFWKAVTFLGNAGWFWILLALLLLFWKQTRKTGMAALLALMVGALITNVWIKPAVARPRPYDVVEGLVALLGPQMDYSFPSGHSCAAFAAAMVCWRMLPHKYGLPLLVLAGLLAFSRLYLGVHYPSDVAGGILIGLASGWVACRIMAFQKHQEKMAEKQ
ncbi:MAG: phosphatase PAP2 family protein [Clostridia bacterium]|nr:phosphatase PAP2 family protein [Clostridia bacterium]